MVRVLPAPSFNMDREKMIEEAECFLVERTIKHEDDGRLIFNGMNYPELTADFTISQIEKQAVQFCDNVTANKEAYAQGKADGEVDCEIEWQNKLNSILSAAQGRVNYGGYNYRKIGSEVINDIRNSLIEAK